MSQQQSLAFLRSAVPIVTDMFAFNTNTRHENLCVQCLCPLFSVDGWQITTIEGLGSEKEGFHPIQQRIAKANGSQCGYCTPGIVMAMYG